LRGDRTIKPLIYSHINDRQAKQKQQHMINSSNAIKEFFSYWANARK